MTPRTPSLGTDDKFLPNFFSKYPVRSLSKNRPLLYQGEIPTMGFYIKSGIVKLYNITSEGEERVVGYESNNSLLPIEWLFSKSPVSLYYYDTFTDCEVIRIGKDELIEALNQNPTAAYKLMADGLSMYLGATIHLHALQQAKARLKLLYIMQYLVLRFGKKLDSKHQAVELRLTHQEIANLIGITRETVSMEISKLIKEKVLQIDDYQYIVDMDKAVRLLGEDDFKELNL
jgi:CRP/FNR family transcriptional regulator, cyclic AMP receptor protein